MGFASIEKMRHFLAALNLLTVPVTNDGKLLGEWHALGQHVA
jgi:hypothetical protein